MQMLEIFEMKRQERTVNCSSYMMNLVLPMYKISQSEVKMVRAHGKTGWQPTKQVLMGGMSERRR